MQKVRLYIQEYNAKTGRIARRIAAAHLAWDALSPVDRLVFAYLMVNREVAADFLEDRGLPRLAVHGFGVLTEEVEGEQEK